MSTRESIIEHLKDKYSPEAVIVYGSFADGTANLNSDFDALVIADRPALHDTTVFDGTLLDVFVYPPETFGDDIDPHDFLQVYDGIVVFDQNGLAGRLKDKVRAYVLGMPPKSDEELRDELTWCEKMLARTVRGDAEGAYRWHWLLVDSLEIYSDLKKQYYFGPKKTLKKMAAEDKEAFEKYCAALKKLDHVCLSEWIDYLKTV